MVKMEKEIMAQLMLEAAQRFRFGVFVTGRDPLVARTSARLFNLHHHHHSERSQGSQRGSNDPKSDQWQCGARENPMRLLTRAAEVLKYIPVVLKDINPPVGRRNQEKKPSKLAAATADGSLLNRNTNERSYGLASWKTKMCLATKSGSDAETMTTASPSKRGRPHEKEEKVVATVVFSTPNVNSNAGLATKMTCCDSSELWVPDLHSDLFEAAITSTQNSGGDDDSVGYGRAFHKKTPVVGFALSPNAQGCTTFVPGRMLTNPETNSLSKELVRPRELENARKVNQQDRDGVLKAFRVMATVADGLGTSRKAAAGADAGVNEPGVEKLLSEKQTHKQSGRSVSVKARVEYLGVPSSDIKRLLASLVDVAKRLGGEGENEDENGKSSPSSGLAVAGTAAGAQGVSISEILGHPPVADADAVSRDSSDEDNDEYDDEGEDDEDNNDKDEDDNDGNDQGADRQEKKIDDGELFINGNAMGVTVSTEETSALSVRSLERSDADSKDEKREIRKVKINLSAIGATIRVYADNTSFQDEEALLVRRPLDTDNAKKTANPEALSTRSTLVVTVSRDVAIPPQLPVENGDAATGIDTDIGRDADRPSVAAAHALGTPLGVALLLSRLELITGRQSPDRITFL